MRLRWLLIAALTCCRTETVEPVKPEAEPALAQPLPQPAPADDVAVATRWLETLRDRDLTELAALTRYPFELHEQDGSCAAQTAPSSEALPSAVACLTRDLGLMGLLRSPDTATVEPLADVHLPAWAKKWHVTTAPSRIVTAALRRNDTRVELDLSIVDGACGGSGRAAWRPPGRSRWRPSGSTR